MNEHELKFSSLVLRNGLCKVVFSQVDSNRAVMSGFFVGLWESVFQPGTSPQLVVATHTSFFLLLCVLGSQIFITGNGHFIALFVIALLLWITVIWFINELNQLKLQSNEELQTVTKAEASEEKKENGKAVASASGNDKANSRKRVKSRKV